MFSDKFKNVLMIFGIVLFFSVIAFFYFSKEGSNNKPVFVVRVPTPAEVKILKQYLLNDSDVYDLIRDKFSELEYRNSDYVNYQVGFKSPIDSHKKLLNIVFIYNTIDGAKNYMEKLKKNGGYATKARVGEDSLVYDQYWNEGHTIEIIFRKNNIVAAVMATNLGKDDVYNYSKIVEAKFG